MTWLLLIGLLLVGCSNGQDANEPPMPTPHTLATWDRNAEEQQVTEYRIYLCEGVACELTQREELVRDTVPQPPIGESPVWHLPKALQGVLAVSAVNAVGESPLSEQVPFHS